MLLPTVVQAQVSIPPGNLTANPSFETNLNGWEVSTNASMARVNNSGAPLGQWAARLTLNSGTSSYSIGDLNYTVTNTQAGWTYTSRAYVKGQSGAQSNIGKEVRRTP